MAIKTGDVDICKDIVDLNYQMIRTQLILEKFVNKNPESIHLDDSDFEEIDRKTIENLVKKYPNMGIYSAKMYPCKFKRARISDEFNRRKIDVFKEMNERVYFVIIILLGFIFALAIIIGL